tara:strand:- start:990 stop:1187 length:198 start_codon:yes stop_codon:yes gene_type:complete
MGRLEHQRSGLMFAYLSKPRRPSYYHAMMFKILCVAAIAGLFWTSAPARTVTADALSTTAEFLRP